MCFHSTKWKRETINDHKFEYIDVNDFVTKTGAARWGYTLIFLRVIKSTLVYIADIYTAISLVVMSDYYNGEDSIYKKSEYRLPFDVLRYIFWGSILISFGLLLWEWRKSRKIYATQDISYSYTSPPVYKYICLLSYPHYCFFRQIDKHRKFKDDVAFYVFFTLKSWKRVLFAESPRQVINGLALIFLFRLVWIEHKGFTINPSAYAKTNSQKMSIFVMLFTFLMYLFSVFSILVAAILYIPLLCSIQGNLKEYCCHKVDKRVAAILKKYSKKRIAMGRTLDPTALDHKDSPYSGGPGEAYQMEPTLPKVDYTDEASQSSKYLGGTPYPERALSPSTATTTAANLPHHYSQAGSSSPPPAFDDHYGMPIQPFMTPPSLSSEHTYVSAQFRPGGHPGSGSVYDDNIPTPHGSLSSRSNNPRAQLADIAYTAGRQPTRPNLDYILEAPERNDRFFDDDQPSNRGLPYGPGPVHGHELGPGPGFGAMSRSAFPSNSSPSPSTPVPYAAPPPQSSLHPSRPSLSPNFSDSAHSSNLAAVNQPPPPSQPALAHVPRSNAHSSHLDSFYYQDMMDSPEHRAAALPNLPGNQPPSFNNPPSPLTGQRPTGDAFATYPSSRPDRRTASPWDDYDDAEDGDSRAHGGGGAQPSPFSTGPNRRRPN